MKYQTTSANNDSAFGERIYDFALFLGVGAGDLVYLAAGSPPYWKLARANAVSTSGGVLLGIAAGSSGTTDGVLIRGFARFDTKFPTPPSVGAPVYVSDITAGDLTYTAPSTAGVDVVRIVGYSTTGGDSIYFCPDNTWVEL